jgi:hypothetical protein
MMTVNFHESVGPHAMSAGVATPNAKMALIREGMTFSSAVVVRIAEYSDVSLSTIESKTNAETKTNTYGFSMTFIYHPPAPSGT